MSVDLSFILFCESIVGCQIAIDKMTLCPDLRITNPDVLRKFIRGLTVVGHKSPTECDSMGAGYVKLYSRYNAYIECADPAVHADHNLFSSKNRLFAEIQAIHTRWSLSCPRNKVPPATWVAMTPDLMAPTDHVMHLSDDDMMFSLSTMDDASFDHILAVCDNSADDYAPPDDARAHCDALLALAPGDFDSLLMAREFKMAGTNAASRQNQSNQLAISHQQRCLCSRSVNFGVWSRHAWSWPWSWCCSWWCFRTWVGPSAQRTKCSDGFVSHNLPNPTRSPTGCLSQCCQH